MNQFMCFNPVELAPLCSAELRFAWSKYTCPYVIEAPCDFHWFFHGK